MMRPGAPLILGIALLGGFAWIREIRGVRPVRSSSSRLDRSEPATARLLIPTPPLVADSSPKRDSPQNPLPAAPSVELGSLTPALLRPPLQEDKHSLRQTLVSWRARAQISAENRDIEDRIASADLLDLASAAGPLLLEIPENEEQIDGLCSILSAEGSPSSIEWLAEAVRNPKIRAAALRHLAATSNPTAVPGLCRLLSLQNDPSLRDAAARALSRVGRLDLRRPSPMEP